MFKRILMLVALISNAMPVVAGPNDLKVLDEHLQIQPETLGLVVNRQDPLSREIADYYRDTHNIPEENIIEVDLPVAGAVDKATFEAQYEKVKQQTPEKVQGYALAFWQPYRVDCLSVTTAFTFGFDSRFCASGCRTTRYSPYFSSSSHAPWRDHQIRPSMSIAARTFSQARKLIDRGKASRESWPTKANGFVLQTSDAARSVRRLNVKDLARLNLEEDLKVFQEQSNELRGARHLMFYFTGQAQVPNLERNIYLPGAAADHLTSYGGVLDGTGQMSALRWLEAGATGSYGTVVEPCNFGSKFPNPTRLIDHYRAGSTLLEAYWKSVAMPGQGIFIGDPLAQPWGGYQVSRESDWVSIVSRTFTPGDYQVFASASEAGPFVSLGKGVLPPGDRRFTLQAPPEMRYFKVEKLRVAVGRR